MMVELKNIEGKYPARQRKGLRRKDWTADREVFDEDKEQ
jgi:hypothetical protein